ncbi:MAG: methylated-DNA--[protein]-cysteine S-methyltransferase [Flavitalea sp.]
MQEDNINYQRIEKAIGYLKEHFRDQPSLDRIAEEVHLSPFHFQKMFQEWAGVSPKKFLQFLTVEHAKLELREKQSTLFDAAFETGLSGTGRLHDLFISIEGMTPGEYKNGGESLTINYSFEPSPFGEVLIASTSKGICYMAFVADNADPYALLVEKFPKAKFQNSSDQYQQQAMNIFDYDWKMMPSEVSLEKIRLHLKGSPFQLKVWETLLRIPFGGLDTYGSLARKIENEKAARAVGSAVGDNPVAFLIPCHRVIQSSGISGHYHWGPNRKSAIIGWEAAAIDPESVAKAV